MLSSVPIRLVALDLDGTLLSHHSEVTPRTRQAIAQAGSAASAMLSPPTVPPSGIWAQTP